jgi:hypothetical protein
VATAPWRDLGRHRWLGSGAGCRPVGGPRCGAAQRAAGPRVRRRRLVTGVFEVAALARLRRRQENRAHEFMAVAVKVAEESAGERGPVHIETKVLYSAVIPALAGPSEKAGMVVLAADHRQQRPRRVRRHDAGFGRGGGGQPGADPGDRGAATLTA